MTQGPHPPHTFCFAALCSYIMSSFQAPILRRSSSSMRLLFSQKKRVRFSLTKEVFPTAENDWRDCDETTPTSLWWTRDDLELFKWEASLLVGWIKYDESLRGCISHAAELAGCVAASTKSETKLQRKLVNLSVDPGLSSWCNGLERGIEKYLRRNASRQTINNGRTSCPVLTYRKTVIYYQRRLSSEQLRGKCLNISREDRVFACMMGQADAYAAVFSIAAVAICGSKSKKELTSSRVALANAFGGSHSLRHRQVTSKQA